MFRPTTAVIFGEVFVEVYSRWPKNVGGYAKYNKSTNQYMHILLFSHKTSSMHGHESFKIDT